MFLDPFPVGEHSFLVTARTGIAGLAGIGEQIIVTALITKNSGKALVQARNENERDNAKALESKGAQVYIASVADRDGLATFI